MSTLEKNINTLRNLQLQFPKAFEELGLDGSKLTYNGDSVDISTFDIASLCDGINPFYDSLDELHSNDVYKIIRLHCIGSRKTTNISLEQKDKMTDEEKLEVIKQENPLLNMVTIINKPTEYGIKQYFNIVDKNGMDHLFYNDRNVDILAIYETLKLNKGSNDITPEELIEAVNRKIYELNLMKADTAIDSQSVNEDFQNKIAYQDELYKNEKAINVLGNEEHDITLVNDDRNNSGHQVLTYENNEFGDVVATTHNQNVNGEMMVQKDGTEVSSSTTVGSEDTDEVIVDNTQKEIIFELIPEEEFYTVLNTGEIESDKVRNSVNLWYAFLEDLTLYEDFLNDDLKQTLYYFRKYIETIQLAENIVLNELQVEACDNLVEFEANKQEKQLGTDGLEKVQQYVYTKKMDYNDNRNAAFISTAQLLVIIFSIAVILTAIAMYIIK